MPAGVQTSISGCFSRFWEAHILLVCTQLVEKATFACSIPQAEMVDNEKLPQLSKRLSAVSDIRLAEAFLMSPEQCSATK